MYLSTLVAFLFLGASLPAEGCSCRSKHLQRFFCEASNVVLKVKFLSANYTDVTSDSYNYSLITYEIALLQVFKGSSDLQNLKYIHTSSEYYCDFHVSPSNYNKDYLVAGPYAGGRVYLIYCDYGVPWSALSAFQIKGIQGAYTKGCDCNVFSCDFGHCNGATNDGCTFEGRFHHPDEINNPEPEEDNTPVEDKMCARNKSGICVWQSVEQR